MQRYLSIKNFRNIGINEEQKLIINTSLNEKEIGNVVYLVGPNNSGKSNVLNALQAFKNNSIVKSDRPDFTDDLLSTELKLVSFDNKTTYEQLKTLDKQNETDGYYTNDPKLDKKETYKLTNQTKQFYKESVKWVLNQTGNGYNWLNELYIELSKESEYILDTETFIKFNNFVTRTWGKNFYLRRINNDVQKVDKFLKELLINDENYITKMFLKKYKIKLIPNILELKNIERNQNEFKINVSQVNDSAFFEILFKTLNYSLEDLKRTYEKYNQKNTRGTLEKKQNELNKKLEKVSQSFNKVYLLNNNKYHFKIYLDPNLISFQISLDNTELDYNVQSTGFKWFFNFYFTLVAQNNLEPGDIILMDEPATNLHVSGIIELRNFIRDYAKKNKLVFVISTHSPFLIDLDYLDNVRVIDRVSDKAKIKSKFHLLEKDSSDSLEPIKEALTVSRHILMDPTKKTFFVEGVTDYCYLTAFKQLLKYEDIVFLPINGLNDSENKKTLKHDDNLFNKLLQIERYPTLLVDGDKAGMDAKDRANNKYKDRVEVISLNEIDEKFIKMEDLFDDADKILVKNFNEASKFKANIGTTSISEKTINNFKKLLETITV